MTTLRAGLIGAHISRTRFPMALKALCGAAGIGLEFELIDTAGRADFDLSACVAALQAAGWTGVSVTHPHKPEAAELAGAGMAAEAAGLGAANLLRFGEGIAGFNTDFTGFLGAWGAFGRGAPGRVAMAGAGGVAAAIGPALIRLGAARIDLWDVDPSRAQALAARLGPAARAVPLEAAEDAARAADGLVNATALGMGEDGRSAFPFALSRPSWAFDAVYTPPETPFLKAAARAGLACLSGFELFRHMAVDSFAAYTGLTPDREAALEMLAGLRP